MTDIFVALTWFFGLLSGVNLLFNVFSKGTEDLEQRDKLFVTTFQRRRHLEPGARMAESFFATYDTPVRFRWKLWWTLICLTLLSAGGQYWLQ